MQSDSAVFGMAPISRSLISILTPAGFLLAAIAMIAAAAADSARYQWTSQAAVKVGSKSLRAVHTGVVTATDPQEAERRARIDAERQIKRDYPVGTLDPDSLVVQVSKIIEGLKDEVSITVTIACRYTQNKEEGLRIFSDDFVLISHPREVSLFDSVLTVKGPDGDQSYPRKIRTVGRGPVTESYLHTTIWHGRLVDGGDPVNLSVSLITQEEGTAPTDMGEVAISVRQVDGALLCNWQPVRNAVFKGDPQPERGHHARFELRNGDRIYDLFASAYNPTEYLKIEQRENQEFARKLNDRADSIEVMMGSATAKFRSRDGKILTLGTGKTFVISQDGAAAKAYVARVFPNRPDVIIVKDRATADAALRQAWTEARNGIFKNENVLDNTVEFSLKPKVGRTMSDVLSKFPKRRP